MEPHPTDEPTTGKRNAELETQLLAGCFTISVASLLVLAIGTWPFLVFRDENTSAGLVRSMLVGPGASLLAGVVLVRRLNETGLVAFVGGAMATGFFLYLRLMQVFVAEGTADLPQAEYHQIWSLVVPAAWAVVVLSLAAVAYPKPKQAT